MGIITLTDRISVSVRAKNETESNSQKRATGRNIANALTSGGNANISDDLAYQLGNTSKPTIADEQGREWVSMTDIIAAGKKMQQEGAFKEKEVHEGIDEFNVSNVYLPGTEFKWNSSSQFSQMITHSYCAWITARVAIFFGKEMISPAAEMLYRNDNGDITSKVTIDNNSKAYSVDINGISYSFFKSQSYRDSVNWKEMNGNTVAISNIKDYDTYNIAGYLFGPVHKSGGSLIDWTKPDDEIEEDIRQLHETWDVSDHPGASGQGIGAGTYILAGPIEFNPGD